MIQLPEVRWSHIATAVTSGILFSLSFRLNQYFDEQFVYSAGISLLFLPAGVKLLAVLVGRLPAILGLLVVGIYLGVGIWPDKSMASIVYFAIVSLMTYPVAAFGLMRVLHIRHDLSNLRYHHIVLLSLAASVLNGVVHNWLYWSQGVTASEELWQKSAAMAMGDFMGCFVVVALFHAATGVLRRARRHTPLE
jgi:predicted permease